MIAWRSGLPPWESRLRRVHALVEGRFLRAGCAIDMLEECPQTRC